VDIQNGILGDQLQVIRNLRNHFGMTLQILETVFAPIEIAHRLMRGRKAFTELRSQSPNTAHELLRTITNVFSRFCTECLSAGADGIFFATKWATSDQMAWAEYEQFGKPYELEIINALSSRNALIVLHVCGERTYLPKMLDYNVDVFSYDFYGDGALYPAYVQDRTGKQVLGGIDPEQLRDEPEEAAEKCKMYLHLDHWIAGPSCVVPPTVSGDSIRTFLKRFDSIRS
jgi:uroporphyrinogen decarboxylase